MCLIKVKILRGKGRGWRFRGMPDENPHFGHLPFSTGAPLPQLPQNTEDSVNHDKRKDKRHILIVKMEEQQSRTV